MSECTAERDLIFGEISRERAAQDEQWGGPVNDDSRETWEWCTYIRKQLELARTASWKIDRVQFEHRMVKIAALALAAIESSRRKPPYLTTAPVPDRDVAEQKKEEQI